MLEVSSIGVVETGLAFRDAALKKLNQSLSMVESHCMHANFLDRFFVCKKSGTLEGGKYDRLISHAKNMVTRGPEYDLF